MLVIQNKLLVIAEKLQGIRNGWLMPNGKLVIDHLDSGILHSWHNEMGQYIVRDHFKLKNLGDAMDYCDDVLNVSYAIEWLEDNHWIRLHGFGGMTPVWILNDVKPTRGQENTMLDWCIANNRKYRDNDALRII